MNHRRPSLGRTSRSILLFSVVACTVGPVVPDEIFSQGIPLDPVLPLQTFPGGDELKNRSTEWFWPDPLSRLGTVSSAGDGWHYLVIGTDKAIGKQLGISEKNRQALKDIRETIIELDRNRRANGLPTSRRHEIWTKGAEFAEKVVPADQHRQLRQLLLQRHSFKAFSRQIVISRLRLTTDQRKSIDEASRRHDERLQSKRVEVAEMLKLFASTSVSETDRNMLQGKLLLRESGAYGRASHRRVWKDIHQILSVDQRAKFNELRGAMPESIRPSLKLFPSLDEWEPAALNIKFNGFHL
jgi:hypothetical protein